MVDPNTQLQRTLTAGAVSASNGDLNTLRSSGGTASNEGFANIINNADYISPNGMKLSEWFANNGFDKSQVLAYWDSLDETTQNTIRKASDPFKALTESYKTAGGPKSAEKNAAAAKIAAADQNIDNELLAMYESYKRPIFDAGGQIIDPTARMLAQGAAGLGATAAYGAAGEGGMNGRVAAQAANSALVPYQQFREQQASNALGAVSNRAIGMRTLAEQGRQFDAGGAMQDQANQYNANRGLGSTIGGVAGGIAGGLATIFTGGAAAPLIPGLIGAGSAIGGQVGGGSAPSSGASYRKYGGGY